MDIYQDKKMMVLDTEYETNPKRLICISYIVYHYIENKWEKEKHTYYLKPSDNTFSINENGEAFQFHKITNEILQTNGIGLKEALNHLFESLKIVDVVIGQNIISADIQVIRKEAIGIDMWFSKIRERLKEIKILDTMIAFREKNPEERSSLDKIYKFLFDKEMKEHHIAIQDCKNTFKCFQKMVEDNYNFVHQKINFVEETFEEVMKEAKKCSICEVKIPEGNCVYKYFNEELDSNDRKYKICNSFIKKDDELCKKCLGNVELMIKNNNGELIDLVKLKTYDSCIKDFFTTEGNEEIIVYLVSTFKEKEEIKKLGGKWDGRKKSWYFSYNYKTANKLTKFSKWIPNESDL